MWRWMMRVSAVFLFSSFFLASPASAHPQFYDFGVPGGSIGVEDPYYYSYPGYGYPSYGYPGYGYPGYGYPGYGYPNFAYSYPENMYGYAWRDGHLSYYNRYRGDGGQYVRPYGPADWRGGRDH
jgi:hypothetical protein